MKNIFLFTILMIGLLVTNAIGNQVKASHPELVSCHPELVSGPPQTALASHPELVSRHPEFVSCHPELVSGPQTVASSALPETTISASVSSSIEATIGDTVPVAKGNFFANNWGALLMGLLGFADLIARLTPSEKDNSIINFLTSILNAIVPNLKKGGGRL